MKEFKKYLPALFIVFIAFFTGPFTKVVRGNEGKIVIKLGTVAPEGSTYMELAHNVEREIEKRFEGKVDIKWYAGGVLGDEPDMLRLMKLGQLQGAGLTGMGLGHIDIAVRAVELPFLMKNYSEVDKVLNTVLPVFQEKVRKRGFELLGPAENGFVYFFGKNPIRGVSDLRRGFKMWVWDADKFARDAFSQIPGILSVPLPIIDVLTGLATGLVDGFYNTTLAAVALQWTTKVNYMLDYPIVYGSAWVVMQKKFYDTLPKKLRQIFNEEIAKFSNLIKKRTREDNKKALNAIISSGIKPIKPGPEELRKSLELGKKIQDNLAGKYVPKNILELIRSVLKK